MATPNIDPKLLEIIQLEARKQAEAVYAQKGTMFGVANVPTHAHNGIDSTQLSAQAISDFVPLDSTGDGVSAQTSGILAVARAEGQRLNDQDAAFTPATGAYVKPIPIIYGHGVGVGSQFDGGLAPNGTLIIFSNQAIAQQLWWRAGDQWWGVDVTSGYGFGANALGPA